jgi:hypothetical protein
MRQVVFCRIALLKFLEVNKRVVPRVQKKLRAAFRHCLSNLALDGLLVVLDRRALESAAVRCHATTDGGIVAAGWIVVVTTEKSVPKTLRHLAVSEESGFRSGGHGLRGFGEGRFGADDVLGEKACSLGPQWVYIFTCRKAKTLIPAEMTLVS